MSLADSAGIVVAEERLDDVLSGIAALLSRTRTKPVTAERFDWLYRKNPDGQASIWSLRHASDGEMIGFTACLPRRMLVGGQTRICWNGVDFSIDPRFRTLGPAAKLRRQARLGIEAGRADFLYAHPNNRMAVVHRLVGHKPVGAMVRLARPLRLGPYAGERLKSSTFGRVAGAVLDPLYRLSCRESWSGGDPHVRFVAEPRFDEAFDELFSRHARVRRIVGVRDSRYLNWRYAQNPLYRTHALRYDRDGRLLGYLLFTTEGEVLHVKDLFPVEDPAVLSALIGAAVRMGWSTGLKGLSIAVLEHNPLIQILSSHGFRVRTDHSQMYAYCTPQAGWHDTVLSPQEWFLISGDRDV
jgi:hypothetical protein